MASKLGRANNLVRQFAENTGWDEPPNNRKLASNVKSVIEDEAEKISIQEVETDETGK